MKVAEIMTRPVITVTPETGIKGAAELLVQYGISALPVVDTQGELVGIVSEADLLPIETRPDPRRQATPLPPTSGSMPQTVAEVMTRRVLTVPSDCEVSQVARILLEADFRRVPVVTGRRLVGIVSRRDLVNVIATRDDTIESEIVRRLGQLGLGTSLGNIGVAAGVATIQLDDREPNRRLAESVALTVPGVLEVRFANSKGR
jgi:CBS-domain-containing membrane protein